MKVVIILAILSTLAFIFFQYSRSKNLKILFISLFTFGMIVSLAVVGNVTRQIILLYLVHNILIIFSWVGLIFYLLRDRYYWWIIFSPIVTIGLFLLLEVLTGSGHEGIFPQN